MNPISLTRRLATAAEQAAGLQPGEIFHRCNQRRYAWPRFAVMKVARERGRTLHQIANQLGRDHSTVVHGAWRGDILERGNPEFRALVDKLREVAA